MGRPHPHHRHRTTVHWLHQRIHHSQQVRLALAHLDLHQFLALRVGHMDRASDAGVKAVHRAQNFQRLLGGNQRVIPSLHGVGNDLGLQPAGGGAPAAVDQS